MARGRRGGRNRNKVDKKPLPDKVWRMKARTVNVVDEGAAVTRRLFLLLELMGERGAHVSSMCDVLAVNTTILSPLLDKLRRAGRVLLVRQAGQFVPGGVYRVASQEEQGGNDAPRAKTA